MSPGPGAKPPLMSAREREFVRDAAMFLENPSFLIRVANTVGKPIEFAVGRLPDRQKQVVKSATEAALKKGLVLVAKTISSESDRKSFFRAADDARKTGLMHSLGSFGTGAAGGFFGMAALPIELPVTTAIMLRSIASIAHGFGLKVEDPEVQMECLYVLSLGSPCSAKDDAMDSAYWTSRLAFSNLLNEAARFMMNKTAQEIAREIEHQTAPVLIRFIAAVASRFEIVVSEKLLAQAVPIVGAVGGGAINAAFTDYFSDAARFHFGMRALEAKYGPEVIEEIYHEEKLRAYIPADDGGFRMAA